MEWPTACRATCPCFVVTFVIHALPMKPRRKQAPSMTYKKTPLTPLSAPAGVTIPSLLAAPPPQPTPRKQLPILHPQDAKSKLLPPRTMPVGPAAEMSSPTGVHMPATARRSRMRPPARGHSGAHPFRHGLCRKTRQAGRPLCQPCVPCSA